MNIQELLSLAENETIKLYCGDSQDSMAILHWWMELVQSGELEKVIFPSCYDLAPFMNLFQSRSCMLAYNTDDEGKIRLAMWGQQAGPGICWISLWVRKGFRFTQSAVAITIKLYNIAFDTFDILMGITKQKGLLKIHKKAGYTVVGEFPHLWEGAPGYLVMLTAQDFYSAIEMEA